MVHKQKSNGIEAEGGRVIGEALKENNKLEKINLSGNKHKMKTEAQHLTNIDNNIGDFGTKSFGEALKVNKTLKKLYLGRAD